MVRAGLVSLISILKQWDINYGNKIKMFTQEPISKQVLREPPFSNPFFSYVLCDKQTSLPTRLDFETGLPGPKKLKRPNLAISSFKKDQILKNEKIQKGQMATMKCNDVNEKTFIFCLKT